MNENKIQELQNKIDSLQKELNELNELKNSKETKYRCKRLEQRGIYYYINYESMIVCRTSEFCSIDDNTRYEAGNYFTDKELAEKLLEIYKRNPMYLIATLSNYHYYERTGMLSGYGNKEALGEELHPSLQRYFNK